MLARPPVVWALVRCVAKLEETCKRAGSNVCYQIGWCLNCIFDPHSASIRAEGFLRERDFCAGPLSLKMSQSASVLKRPLRA
jgi:hypothetical protein